MCDVFGHRVPRRRRPFFLTDRYQRCERCRSQIAIKHTRSTAAR